MNELDKLKRAKMYIDKLADGINPLDDTRVGENDVVNQVRIVRCLNYVSDVLSQVIGKSEKPRKSGIRERDKEIFTITREQLDRFRYSNAPVTISEIVNRLSELVDRDRMKRFSSPTITGWLLESGLLYNRINEKGNTHRLPTEAGKEIGIITELRQGQQGPYCAVLYSREAQQFILDNFEAILAYRDRKPEHSEKPWSDTQDQLLMLLVREGFTASEIADIFKRTENEIVNRMKEQ